MWDLDNTFYAYLPSHRAGMKACSQMAKEAFGFSEETFIESYSKSRSIIHERLHHTGASHSRLLYFKLLLEQLTGRTQYQWTLALEQCYWDHFMQHMKMDVRAWNMLQCAHDMQISMCIVTDLTTEIQHKKVMHLGLDKYIPFMVTSEEAGMEKPHPITFQLGLKHLNTAPSETLMIGDSEEKDILGAKQLGLQTLHFVAEEQ